MMRGPWIFLLLFVLGFSAETFAQSPKNLGIIVDAEDSEGDFESTLILRGNVQIIFKDQHLKAQWARVNFRARTIEARGRFTLTSPLATIGGESVLLDYESDTGTIIDGYVQSGPTLFQGEEIAKLGPEEYLANEASFTACSNCPETWLFTGEKIRAELGGYAFIKSGFLKVGGVPVIWLPYLILPLKSDRQTGLLTPEFEKSDRGGFTFGQSFFWAIDRSQDATFTYKSYELRGSKYLLNYRYMLGPNSYGEFSAATLSDRAFGKDARLNSYRSPSQQGEPISRWFTKYDHYLELPEDFVHRLSLNNASDLQYPQDFSLETRNNGDSAMENRMSLTRNTAKNHFSVDSSYYVNLLDANPLASNSDSVHRAPEVRYAQSLQNLGDSGFLFSYELNSTNFVRSTFGYDDINAPYNPNGPNDRHLSAGGGTLGVCSTSQWYNNPICSRERDGRFDSDRDLIRTGHRFDGRASLLYPLHLWDFLDVVPRMTYRETYYQFNIPEDRNNRRSLLRTEVTARSLFSKVYGDLEAAKSDRIKHEIQPEISYTVIPWLQHPSHPFFGSQQETPFFSQESISDADFNGPYGLQFDYNDRLYDRRLVRFAITNRLIQKRWLNNSPSYRQAVFWRVAQSYDFYQADLNRPNRQPLSDLSSELRIGTDQLTILQNTNYFPYQQVTNLSSRVRWTFMKGDFFQVGHTLSYPISPGQPVDPNSRIEEITLTLRHIFAGGEILGKLSYDASPQSATQTQRLKSYGYVARLKLPGDCWYFNLTQYRPAGGANTTTFSFDFSWDGSPKPNIPESLLESLFF